MKETYIPLLSFITTVVQYNLGNLPCAAVFAVGTMFSAIMYIDDNTEIE